jgi:hypothetical protein
MEQEPDECLTWAGRWQSHNDPGFFDDGGREFNQVRLEGERLNSLIDTLQEWENHLARLASRRLRSKMKHSRHKFNGIAKPKAEKAKYPPPFSLSLTYEARARLDAERGDKSLAAYIRKLLFGDDAAPRKRRGNSPVQDKEALGRVMRALGQSLLSANLNQLAKAVNTGSLACDALNQSRTDRGQPQSLGHS